MSSRYEFTTAKTGFTLDLPGSTADGAWEEPLDGWGLGLGDPGGTALVIEDDLASIKELLTNALNAVERRLELEGAGDFREVTVDGSRYTVPSARYREGMSADEVWKIAVLVQEDADGEDES